jgi:membrane-bound serine protease (ClpP class)
MIGETGVATSALVPDGMVFVRGEYWSAISPAPLPPGSRVRVTSIEGLRLTVEPIAQ